VYTILYIYIYIHTHTHTHTQYNINLDVVDIQIVYYKEQRNILHEISKRKSNWIGHILHRNCVLQQVIKVKIKGGI